MKKVLITPKIGLLIVLMTLLFNIAVAEDGVMAVSDERKTDSIITYDEYLERMEEYSAFKDSINRRIAQIKKEGPLYYGSYEQFAQEINELSAQKVKIEWKISALNGDDSLSASAKKARLNAELSEIEAEMDELYAAKSRSSQIAALDREAEEFYESLFGACSGSFYTHDMRRWVTVKKQTCEEAGEKHNICILCGYYVIEYLDALGHVDGDVYTRIEPTETAEGVCVVVCANCFEVIRTEMIPATGSSRLPGDANVDSVVDVSDALCILRLGAEQNVVINTSNADVTGDGKVDSQDVLRIMQYAAGWDVELK